MEEVIELKKYKQPIMVVNPDLDKYEDVVLFPKKLQDAIETLARCPIPADILLQRFSKTKQEQGFEINGILESADTAAHTFLVIVTVNKYHQINYNIRTAPETLNQLVKAFLDKPIKIHIRPQINADNLFEYELIEVKVD